MSSTYHQAHSFEEFKDDYWFYTDDLYTLHPKHFIVFSGDTATLCPKSFDVLYAGPAYELVKVDGEWYFTGKSNFYLD
jgi:hypothetical protein